MSRRPTAYCDRCESTVYSDDVHSCYDAKAVREDIATTEAKAAMIRSLLEAHTVAITYRGSVEQRMFVRDLLDRLTPMTAEQHVAALERMGAERRRVDVNSARGTARMPMQAEYRTALILPPEATP